MYMEVLWLVLLIVFAVLEASTVSLVSIVNLQWTIYHYGIRFEKKLLVILH